MVFYKILGIESKSYVPSLLQLDNRKLSIKLLMLLAFDAFEWNCYFVTTFDVGYIFLDLI